MDMTHEGARIARAQAGRDATEGQVRGGEYLAFHLGNSEYGVDIQRVQELRSYEPPTKIAHAPQFLKGVVNLRGAIVPIVDLRLKLACDCAEYGPLTAVIVLNVRGRVIGVVVDSVTDVVELGPHRIRPAPAAGSPAGSVVGIGSVDSGDADRRLILMDLETLLSGAEMGLVQPIA